MVSRRHVRKTSIILHLFPVARPVRGHDGLKVPVVADGLCNQCSLPTLFTSAVSSPPSSHRVERYGFVRTLRLCFQKRLNWLDHGGHLLTVITLKRAFHEPAT